VLGRLTKRSACSCSAFRRVEGTSDVSDSLVATDGVAGNPPCKSELLARPSPLVFSALRTRVLHLGESGPGRELVAARVA
jgi:hypothetical protein